VDKESIEAYYAAYNSGDPAALKPFYADDVVLLSAQGEVRGSAALIDTFLFITQQFVDQMTPQSIVIEGSRAVVEIEDVFTAKQDVADFLGRALRKGDSFKLNLCGVYEFSEAKFTRIRIYQG
jgi:ketosteroid isomerase-like protein